MSYETLIDEHEAIDRLSSKLLNSLEAGASASTAAHDLLCRLQAVVDQHIEHEDSLLYARVASFQSPTLSENVRLLETSFDTLRSDWRDYVETWSEDRINSDWHTFAEETKSIVPQVKRRVLEETELVYLPALKSGLISLRAAYADRA